jgi:hypothetical protein
MLTNRTTDNASKLTAALNIIQTAVHQAAGYLTSNSAISPPPTTINTNNLKPIPAKP